MKQFIHWLTHSYYGSNNLSRFVRNKLENLSIRQVIGVNLASLAFFGAFVIPQTQGFVASTEVYFDTQQTSVNLVVADSTFRWPMAQFGISQLYSGGHPGVDLTDPHGTPVYPIADGTITAITSLPWGYGKHLVITHSDSVTATYAHLSAISVQLHQPVTKQTEIGKIGHTGWATGDHLHLEIYTNGSAVNPIEILPDVKKFQESDFSQMEASTPLPYLSL